ncbi:MAG: DUF3368 domain-containing protein [Verrucomicrobia bacterium]|nr:DUF3368 domain-containing protein [Verrucomicrobiota bacterium]
MPERIVLCDASPLVYLHRIQCLDLLERLYGRVIVPAAVAAEIRRGLQLGHACPRLESLSWVRVQSLPKNVFPLTVPDLGPGEAELIALARMEPGSLAILDDTLARQVAKLNGVKVTGTAGVLLRAKQRGLITSVSERLNQLLAEGFWLDDNTRRLLLRAAGE